MSVSLIRILYNVQLQALVAWFHYRRAAGLAINGKCFPPPRYQAMKPSHLLQKTATSTVKIPLVILIEMLVIFLRYSKILRAVAHQLHQHKHQDKRQKTQSCFIRDSDSSPHTEVARVCVLSHFSSWWHVSGSRLVRNELMLSVHNS
jgi:hypothetical protein